MKDCHDAAAAIRSLTEQLEALQHDIERHVQIAADLATRLDAEHAAREEVEQLQKHTRTDWLNEKNRATAAESKLASVERELEDMRVIAANPLAIQKVHDELGPLSLWS